MVETELHAFGRARTDTTVSTTWQEEEDKGLLARSKSPRRQLASIALGAIGGVALGIILLFVLMKYTLLFPSMIHRAVATAIFLILGILGGATCLFAATRACQKRTSRCGDGKRFDQMSYIIVALLAFTAFLLLAIPSNTQSSIWAAVHFFVGSGATTLPAGYCAEAENLTRQHGGGIWWHRWGSTPEAAAQQLVQEMTAEERQRLVQGVGWERASPERGYFVGNILGVPRLGVPSINMQDAAQGYRTLENVMKSQVTSWPCGLAVAATWDRALVYEWGRALGREFRAKGANMILGPSVNVHRIARNGRNAEYISGEDPALGVALAPQYIRGVQAEGVGAVVKHYVLNSQETNRMTSSSDADERTLQEVYLPPFAAAVRAGTAAVMCAYNRVRGEYACGNNHTLNTILKTQLGFRGFVMSDWWAVHSPEAADGGVDQNQPGTDEFFSAGRLEPDVVTGMAVRVMRGMLSSGAFNSSSCTAGCDCERLMLNVTATSEAHISLARRLGASSAVLLKNSELPKSSQAGSTDRQNVLPLRLNDVVALIGSACDAPHDIDVTGDWMQADYYVMGGSGRVVSNRAVSIRQGLENRGIKLNLAPSEDLDAALRAMVGADIALVCAGTTSTEMRDRPNLELDQHNFLSELAEHAPIPLVAAVIAPGAIIVSPWIHGASAAVAMFLAGQETGNAWADVLLGDVNPSGKLPVTFPASEQDAIQPCSDSNCEYSEGLFSGWRRFTGTRDVSFPFGHGLSYTTFDYTWEYLPIYDVHKSAVLFSLQVQNNGSMPGAEVVQLYVRFPPEAGEPDLLLKGFAKTLVLSPGESASVSFELDVEQHLSIWGSLDTGGEGWKPVYGAFEVGLGSSSRDLRLLQNIMIHM
ncbi:hypothetical protein AB1Y20_004537 [Prymnesium parvum]|uniref:Probable beta-glucosidase G n=1 Tax=Prymnesium parvum TaxID=97485 RepID=A0AB34IZE3_PRYPA